MNESRKQMVTWIPRILCILFAVFISLFALDVFSEGYGFFETILALFMHLIPTWLVIIALVISWRREEVGGSLFILFSLLFLVMSRGEGWIISVPLFVVGGLFLSSWYYSKPKKT